MKTLFSKEFIIYCFVGLINTIIGTSTAFICLNLFLYNYIIAVGSAYVIGNVTSFYLNKTYTFKNKDKSASQFLKFFITMLPAYIVSYWLGYKIAHFLSLFGQKFLNELSSVVIIPTTRLIDNFAVIISMIIYLFAGFTINKFFVFKNDNK